jgi:hypothetical protein
MNSQKKRKKIKRGNKKLPIQLKPRSQFKRKKERKRKKESRQEEG